MNKNRKTIIVIVAVLLIAVAILGLANRNRQQSAGPGLIITSEGKEISVAFDSIQKAAFSGELVNGKGEKSSHDYEGIELKELFDGQKTGLASDASVTVTSEDNYSAELSAAEVLESGKVYVALTQDGKMIEGIEGGQGAQLIVFGDPNSKRAVRYMKYIEIK